MSGYDSGYADGNMDASMTVRPVLETVLARYGADMTPELKEQIMAALRELWPFEEEATP